MFEVYFLIGNMIISRVYCYGIHFSITYCLKFPLKGENNQVKREIILGNGVSMSGR